MQVGKIIKIRKLLKLLKDHVYLKKAPLNSSSYKSYFVCFKTEGSTHLGLDMIGLNMNEWEYGVGL